MLSASLSMMLCLISALDRILLAKANRCRALLCEALLCGQLIPILICSSPDPSPTPDTSPSKYSVVFHCRISCIHFS